MIKVEHISKSFGSLKVFDDFSLDFPEGKITAILGPSGCGKTTLLNILANLVKVDRGNVITTDGVSYLFQEPRLLPWLTIRQNIDFVLQDKIPDIDVKRRPNQYLEATGLDKYANYYPSQLSGGMRQRAAMARAFSYDAPLLLMDEPFKSLDIKTRFQLMQDFLNIWVRKPRTVVMITHDIKEAVLLGSKVVILTAKPVRVLEEQEIEILHQERLENELIIHLEKTLLKQLLS